MVLNNVSIKPYNTFGVDVKAKYFAVVEHPAQIQDLLNDIKFKHLTVLFLGGGSNILFTKDFDGLVLKVNIKGINHNFNGENDVTVNAGAGEDWSNLVEYCVNQGWGGLENLSLIPGTVGAAPIQNIGAYGVELKDVFSHLEALDQRTFELRRFALSDCNFAYRNSIFKSDLKGRFLITSVSFKLSAKPEPNLTYPALAGELKSNNEKITIRNIADAVIRIRRSKLPDPEVLGNAGSFFKNPVVEPEKFDFLKSANPTIPFFLQPDGSVKIPAAWLIEQGGWKGKRYGDAGVHENQPLVLVNYGQASGIQILELASRIKDDVFNRYQILLETEVNIL
jgi:UDP-N-acetylmuramate dehydrogenase